MRWQKMAWATVGSEKPRIVFLDKQIDSSILLVTQFLVFGALTVDVQLTAIVVKSSQK